MPLPARFVLSALASLVCATVLAPPAQAQTRIPVVPGELLGVALGSAADDAHAALVGQLGQPAWDSGWESGCTGAREERAIGWRGLSVHFADFGEGRVFHSWTGFVPDAPSDAHAEPRRFDFILPGGLPPGASIASAARTYRSDAVFDALNGYLVVAAEGFSVDAEGEDPDTPIEHVGVPWVHSCG
ncbi:hypothetical protein [Maricaulis sp. CAU 1757]